MNYLDLCRDVARESGTLASGLNLSTVTGLTGRPEKIAAWVRKAWLDLQTERHDWLWMQREFETALIIGAARYTAQSFSLDRMNRWHEDKPSYRPWSLYDPAIGRSDETELAQIDYETWRARYDRGVHDRNRPTEYAISPLREFCVGPTPDKAYALRGGYRASAQILTTSSDVPEFDEDYHGIIVWEALRLLSQSDEAQLAVGFSVAQYMRARQRLDRDMLPRIGIVRGARL